MVKYFRIPLIGSVTRSYEGVLGYITNVVAHFLPFFWDLIYWWSIFPEILIHKFDRISRVMPVKITYLKKRQARWTLLTRRLAKMKENELWCCNLAEQLFIAPNYKSLWWNQETFNCWQVTTTFGFFGSPPHMLHIFSAYVGIIYLLKAVIVI